MGNQQVKHSVYLAYDETSYYIGYKSFKTLEQFIKYQTSSSVKKFDKKIILAYCETHSEALHLEDLFISQCISDPKCINKVNNALRMESYIQWCKNNKQQSSKRGFKAVETRKLKYNLTELANKTHETSKVLKVGCYSNQNKLKTKVRNKLMQMQLCLEHGRRWNGRIVSNETFNKYSELANDLNLSFNLINIDEYRKHNSSYQSPTYGLVRKIRGMQKKIWTQVNSHGNPVSDEEFCFIFQELPKLECELQRLVREDVEASASKWVSPKDFFTLGEDIVSSLSKDKAALKRLEISEIE